MATLDAESTTGYGATTTAVCTVDSNQIAEGSVGCATAMEDDNKSSAQQIAWERGGGEHDTMQCDARSKVESSVVRRVQLCVEEQHKVVDWENKLCSNPIGIRREGRRQQGGDYRLHCCCSVMRGVIIVDGLGKVLCEHFMRPSAEDRRMHAARWHTCLSALSGSFLRSASTGDCLTNLHQATAASLPDPHSTA